MNNWLSGLSLDELTYCAPSLFVYKDDTEKAASFMYREGQHKPFASSQNKEELIKRSEKEIESRPPKKYWEQVKNEIFILICEDDPKYKELKAKLNAQSERGTTVLVSTISVSIGSVIGVEAGIISSFCALALYAPLKIGLESYCSCKK